MAYRVVAESDLAWWLGQLATGFVNDQDDPLLGVLEYMEEDGWELRHVVPGSLSHPDNRYVFHKDFPSPTAGSEWGSALDE